MSERMKILLIGLAFSVCVWVVVARLGIGFLE